SSAGPWPVPDVSSALMVADYGASPLVDRCEHLRHATGGALPRPAVASPVAPRSALPAVLVARCGAAAGGPRRGHPVEDRHRGRLRPGGALPRLDADGDAGVELGVGVDQRPPPLVVRSARHDHGVRALDQWAGPAGQRRAAPPPGPGAGAGDDVE